MKIRQYLKNIFLFFALLGGYMSFSSLQAASVDSIKIFYKELKSGQLTLIQRKNIVQRALKKTQNKETPFYYYFTLEEAKIEFEEGNYNRAKNQAGSISQKAEKRLHSTKISPAHRPLWENLHVESLFFLGMIEFFLEHNEEAIKYYSKAMWYYGKDSNSLEAAKCYNAIACIFTRQRQFSKAMVYYNKSLAIVQRLGNIQEQCKVLSNMGYNYYGKRSSKKALEYFTACYSLQLKYNLQKEAQLRTLFNLALIQGDMGEIEIAEGYYTKALILASETKQKHLQSYILSNYALFLFNQKKYNQALQVVDSAFKISPNMRITMHLWEIRSDIYAVQGKYAQANQSLKNKYSLYDSINLEEQNEKIEKLHAQFENYKIEQQKQMQAKELELSQKRVVHRNLWLAFLGVFSILLIIIISFLIQRIRRQCRINNLVKSRLHSTMEHEGDKIQVLNEKIENKNKELTSHVLYQLMVRSITDEILSKIKKLKINFGLKPKEKLLVLELEELLDQLSNDKNWEEFEYYFKQINADFFKKLTDKYPDITANGRRLCALISLNLSNKEIASITHRNLRAVTMAKMRLKKQMGLEQEENMYTLLSQL